MAKIPLWRPLNPKKGVQKGVPKWTPKWVQKWPKMGHFGPYLGPIPVYIGKIGVFGPIWPLGGPGRALGPSGTPFWRVWPGFNRVLLGFGPWTLPEWVPAGRPWDPSWAVSQDPYWLAWGYGPGPSQRGSQRGPRGHFGSILGPFLGPWGPNPELP